MVFVKPKRRNSPGIDQISTQMIKAELAKICPDIRKITNTIWNKEDQDI
jgi:hypothetical protein